MSTDMEQTIENKLRLLSGARHGSVEMMFTIPLFGRDFEIVVGCYNHRIAIWGSSDAYINEEKPQYFSEMNEITRYVIYKKIQSI